jgi:DNA processing protein
MTQPSAAGSIGQASTDRSPTGRSPISESNRLRELGGAAEPELRARLAWLLVPGVGPTRCRRLAAAAGGCEAMLRAPVGELAALLRRAPDTVRDWQQAARRANVDGELRRITDLGGVLVSLGAEDYPPLLASIPDPPPLLWMQAGHETAASTHQGGPSENALFALGQGAVPNVPVVAIVGTRRASAYGLETAARFGEGLAASGVAIVSGGARGIDAAAHRAALRVGGRTIAVLGSGLGRRYPPEHDRLFDEIVAGGGAILSEWPIATEPRPGHFPRRNRIVSGLALGVIVVEAARRSGALITARLAVEEHGREAMAVPGRIDMPQSAGCLKAIREGWAAPVASLAEIGEQLAGVGSLLVGAIERAKADHASRKGLRSTDGLDRREDPLDRRIVEIATAQPSDRAAAIDAIVSETGLGADVVAARLVRLRLEGRLSRG